MKVKKVLAFLSVLTIPFTLAICTTNQKVVVAAEESSILNTDQKLGIFRDLTKDEIKQYYSSLNIGDKKDTLLANLQPILKKNQVKLKYESGSTKSTNWDGYYLLDRDWQKSPLTENEISTQKYSTSNIWMDIMYSTPSILVSEKINNGQYKWEEGNELKSVKTSSSAQFDREHVFPKSYGFNGSNSRYKKLTAGCDMQNLHAAEHVGNNIHNNLPYGTVVNKATNTQVKSGITGEIIGYKGNNKDNIEVFEPLDIDKGDVARSIFYMCARYHTYEELGGGDNTPALTLISKPNRASTTEPEDTKTTPGAYGVLDDLLEWNKLDPVSEQEIHRNNLCYNAIQKNRNPFIDYPAWVDVAFGDSDKGIDLSYDDGVSNNNSTDNPADDPANDSKELSISLGLESIVSGNTLDLTKLSVKINDNEIKIEDLSIEVITPDNTTIPGVDLKTFKFVKTGIYKVKFIYKDKEASKDYDSTVDLKVVSNYSLELDTSNVKLVVDAFKKFNFDGLVVTKKSPNSSTVLNSNEYIIEIYDDAGNKLDFSDNYKINKPGEYTVKVIVDSDNDRLEDSFTITVEIPKIFVIIAIVIIVIIAIVVIIVVANKNKKQRTSNRRNSRNYKNGKRK